MVMSSWLRFFRKLANLPILIFCDNLSTRFETFDEKPLPITAAWCHQITFFLGRNIILSQLWNKSFEYYKWKLQRICFDSSVAITTQSAIARSNCRLTKISPNLTKVWYLCHKKLLWRCGFLTKHAQTTSQPEKFSL